MKRVLAALLSVTLIWTSSATTSWRTRPSLSGGSSPGSLPVSSSAPKFETEALNLPPAAARFIGPALIVGSVIALASLLHHFGVSSGSALMAMAPLGGLPQNRKERNQLESRKTFEMLLPDELPRNIREDMVRKEGVRSKLALQLELRQSFPYGVEGLDSMDLWGALATADVPLPSLIFEDLLSIHRGVRKGYAGALHPVAISALSNVMEHMDQAGRDRAKRWLFKSSAGLRDPLPSIRHDFIWIAAVLYTELNEKEKTKILNWLFGEESGLNDPTSTHEVGGFIARNYASLPSRVQVALRARVNKSNLQEGKIPPLMFPVVFNGLSLPKQKMILRWLLETTNIYVRADPDDKQQFQLDQADALFSLTSKLTPKDLPVAHSIIASSIGNSATVQKADQLASILPKPLLERNAEGLASWSLRSSLGARMIAYGFRYATDEVRQAVVNQLWEKLSYAGTRGWPSWDTAEFGYAVKLLPDIYPYLSKKEQNRLNAWFFTPRTGLRHPDSSGVVGIAYLNIHEREVQEHIRTLLSQLSNAPDQTPGQPPANRRGERGSSAVFRIFGLTSIAYGMWMLGGLVSQSGLGALLSGAAILPGLMFLIGVAVFMGAYTYSRRARVSNRGQSARRLADARRTSALPAAGHTFSTLWSDQRHEKFQEEQRKKYGLDYDSMVRQHAREVFSAGQPTESASKTIHFDEYGLNIEVNVEKTGPHVKFTFKESLASNTYGGQIYYPEKGTASQLASLIADLIQQNLIRNPDETLEGFQNPQDSRALVPYATLAQTIEQYFQMSYAVEDLDHFPPPGWFDISWIARKNFLDRFPGTDAQKEKFLIDVIRTDDMWHLRSHAIKMFGELIQQRISREGGLDISEHRRLAKELIVNVTKDEDWRNRGEALEIIALLAGPENLSDLKAALIAEPDWRNRERIEEIIKHLSPAAGQLVNAGSPGQPPSAHEAKAGSAKLPLKFTLPFMIAGTSLLLYGVWAYLAMSKIAAVPLAVLFTSWPGIVMIIGLAVMAAPQVIQLYRAHQASGRSGKTPVHAFQQAENAAA